MGKSAAHRCNITTSRFQSFENVVVSSVPSRWVERSPIIGVITPYRKLPLNDTSVSVTCAMRILQH